MTQRRFEGRVAIVTGAMGGIGLATAKRLTSEGATVVLADIDLSAAQAALDVCTVAGARAIAVSCDVSKEDQVAAVCRRTLDEFGVWHLAVNVAGAMIYRSLDTLDAQAWERVLATNLLGAAHFTRQALQSMAPRGSIVNVASIHAIQTSALVAPYAAAKSALLSLTRSTAIEGRSKGIRANAVLPGAIETPMLRASPNIKSGVEVLNPEDIGTPENVAAAVAFLSSADAAFINGASLVVDGGRLASL